MDCGIAFPLPRSGLFSVTTSVVTPLRGRRRPSTGHAGVSSLSLLRLHRLSFAPTRDPHRRSPTPQCATGLTLRLGTLASHHHSWVSTAPSGSKSLVAVLTSIAHLAPAPICSAMPGEAAPPPGTPHRLEKPGPHEVSSSLPPILNSCLLARCRVPPSRAGYPLRTTSGVTHHHALSIPTPRHGPSNNPLEPPGRVREPRGLRAAFAAFGGGRPCVGGRQEPRVLSLAPGPAAQRAR
jgi:hypothetical protein